MSHVSVINAIRRGRLSASVVYVDGHPKIQDPELADQEWTQNTSYRAAPARVVEQAAAYERKRQPSPAGAEGEPTPSVGSRAESEAAKVYWEAKTKELQFRETAKELVPAAEVRGKLEAVFLACRSKLLGVPSRARQALPHLSVADIGTLEMLIREALEGLAAESTS